MADANWYVVHTYSGYENKVKANIEKTIENRHLEDQILEVRVPLEEAVEMRKAEKLLLAENPFEPKMRPMLVNLIKENQEYKAIVDLKPFDGNNEGIDVAVDKKTLTISGKFDKRILDSEKIINFSCLFIKGMI